MSGQQNTDKAELILGAALELFERQGFDGTAVPELARKAGVGTGTITTFVFFGTKFMREKPQAALGFLRALVRGARDLQGPYLKDPAIAEAIAKQTDLKIEAIERATPYALDPDLDIAKFESQLRDQETVHREHGELNYQGQLAFVKVIDASLVHKAAAGVK